MAKLQTPWRLLKSVLPRRRQLRKGWLPIKRHPIITGILMVGFLSLVCLIAGYLFHVDWIGFDSGVTQTAKISSNPGGTQVEIYSPMKTLWDWLQLFIIPFVLAGVGYLFGSVTKRNAENNRQEETFRSYLDNMSDLLMKPHVHEEGSEQTWGGLIRAHTLNILRRVDVAHKSYVLQFLVETNLINFLVGKESHLRGVNLSGAKLDHFELPKAWLHEIDFSGADLSGANLVGAELQGSLFIRANLFKCQLQGAYLNSTKMMKADLRGADLSGAHFGNSPFLNNPETADLSEADLSGLKWGNAKVLSGYTRTTLRNAELSGVKLIGANLTGADLTSADLSEADLTGANLKDAILSGVDLSKAILTKAKITAEQLKTVKSHQDATMT